MRIIVKPGAEELSACIAERIAEYINRHPGSLLCLAGGDTPMGVYADLVQLQKQGKVDLNSAYYVGLDEWVGLGYSTKGSCEQMMRDTFYSPAGIREERMAVWNGLADSTEEEIRRVLSFAEAHGPISYTLLGIGMNGHVGFNEPGTGLRMGAIMIPLDETTKAVSIKYFDTALPVRYGIGMGAGELFRAKEVDLMCIGAHKAQIVCQVAEGPVTPDVPASLFREHPCAALYADDAAAAMLADR